jgi:hypothetical protein
MSAACATRSNGAAPASSIAGYAAANSMFACARTGNIIAVPAGNPAICRPSISSSQTNSSWLALWLAATDSLMIEKEATIHSQTIQTKEFRRLG